MKLRTTPKATIPINMFNQIIKDQLVELKYMHGKAITTEAVTIYNGLEFPHRKIISQKKEVNIKLISGPWKGKEFLFTRFEIKK